MIIWNPWHGCHKVSEGCQHCYMYFLDRMRGIDTSKVSRNANFDMPLKRGRDGRFKVAPVEEADAWRDEAWAVIRKRPDVVFRILTKRAGRIRDHLPADWGDGYENVMLQVTTENQTRADERLSVLLDVPAKHKGFMAAPLIGPVDAERYLATGQFEQVLCHRTVRASPLRRGELRRGAALPLRMGEGAERPVPPTQRYVRLHRDRHGVRQGRKGVPHTRQAGAEPTGVPFGLELPGQDSAVQASPCGRVALRRADCLADGRVPRNLRHLRFAPHLQRMQQLRGMRKLNQKKLLQLSR